MHCFKCGKALPSDSQFCQYCGTDLTVANLAPSCSAVVEPSIDFCHTCNESQNVAAEATIQADTPPHGENMPENKPIKRRKKWPVILCLGLVIVAAVIAVFFTFDNNQGVDPATIAENVLYLEIYDSSDMVIGSASGFLINDEVTLVTNYHVIEDAYHIVAITATGNKQVDVSTVLTFDEVADLAILRCDEKIGLHPLTLADSDSVKQGDNVYAAGYPLGLANTLSNGIISSRYIENGVDLLQLTAAISSGSSGGALLNEFGQVIGVICAYYEGGQNMNIAIASNEVSNLLSNGFNEISLKQFYADTQPQDETQDGGPGEITYDFYYAEVRTISVADEVTAEYILEKWKSGAATEESIIAIMDEYGADQGGGKLHTIEPGMLVEEVDQWCFDKTRRVGDVAIIETPYGFTICYFSGVVERDDSSLTTQPEVQITPQAPSSTPIPTPAPTPPTEMDTPSSETAFSFLCEWISENYNKTLNRNGVEDKLYQEILYGDESNDIYQIVYCEDINQICLRYTIDAHDGQSFISTLWLVSDGNTFSANLYFYETAYDTVAAISGFGKIYAPNFKDESSYVFDMFTGREELLSDFQCMAGLMYLDSLNFMNYIFYTYALPEGFVFSSADFGFNI